MTHTSSWRLFGAIGLTALAACTQSVPVEGLYPDGTLAFSGKMTVTRPLLLGYPADPISIRLAGDKETVCRGAVNFTGNRLPEDLKCEDGQEVSLLRPQSKRCGASEGQLDGQSLSIRFC